MMIKTAVSLAVLALAAQVSDAFFSTADVQGGNLRMAGGSTVDDVATYSYQVAIRPLRRQAGQDVELPVCSGIVIRGTDNAVSTTAVAWILTSATCALSGSSYRIYAGTNRVQSNTPADYYLLDGSLAIVHPEYLRTFRSADVALIPDQLWLPVTAVTVATLPTLSDGNKGYLAASVSMAGWGYPYDSFDAASPLLRQLSSRVVPNLICSLAHVGLPITGSHICTGGLFNRGPCTGDSGAPLAVTVAGNKTVIGLATLTPANGCSRSKPGIFTRVGSYLGWIIKYTNYEAN
ncbi:hypothetical protein ONE63_007597 [Megalurothrips usitatus]|uniref:Peptidase S1 domain-containing protein n=1 Tax=Megalurothrips usitatus TaxID=439358 RepID=A0AAV7XVU5_9NEOP|nr:hypothetical protein ONE63_007597 [Megalurothrips usitatus]